MKKKKTCPHCGASIRVENRCCGYCMQNPEEKNPEYGWYLSIEFVQPEMKELYQEAKKQ